MAGASSKSEESKLDKLKHFLGIKSSNRGNIHVGSVQLPRKDFAFTAELIKEISPGSPANHRLNTIRDLCDKVQKRRLEENAVPVLWASVQDLLLPPSSSEERHIGFTFLQCLIRGQYEQLGMMRAKFFDVVRRHSLFEDLPHRLELFRTLSKDGKDLEHFEEETGPFMAEWMRDVMSSSKISHFLSLAINVIKFNAAYVDEDVISSLVLNTCLIATTTGQEEDIKMCLKLLDTVVCYSFLPSDSLYNFTVCLCQLINIKSFCKDIWALMRKLLGTHLGHSGIYTMCCILQDRNHVTESGASLLRGAVFFIGMALWSPKKVASLKYPPSSVLPSFQQALTRTHSSVVAFEIVLSVQRLINKQGQELQLVTWDIILDIVEQILSNFECEPSVNSALVSNTHSLLTAMETLHEKAQLAASANRFFSIIETCADKRPESSIMALVSYKAQSISPAHENWIANLAHLIERYFKHEVRTKIRLKVLDVMSDILDENSHTYQDELIELVIQASLSQLQCDPDLEVRKRGAQLLVDLATACQSSKCLDVLELLKRISMRLVSCPSPIPFGLSAASPLPAASGAELGRDASLGSSLELQDVHTAVSGLVAIFRSKLFQLPGMHSLCVFENLVSHVQSHYSSSKLQRSAGSIRTSILECFLELRADDLYRLGLPNPKKGGELAYSHYVVCTYREDDSGSVVEKATAGVPPSSGVLAPSPSVIQCKTTVVPYAHAFGCIRLCLEKERDWLVLKRVLQMLPHLLQNKMLILAADQDDIERFTSRLCSMLSEKDLPESLLNTPACLTRSDFHSYILPVLTCLVSYHSFLDKNRQTELVVCLEFGLVSKCSRICVRALTACALEMQDIMMRRLPAVLLKLSKISATVAMAVPLMEFLSSLTHTPRLYTNFVGDQYMSIFAIALPYTNPFKYKHYTVSLAYHVIAMWFLKCRLPLRKGFVGFIVKGLKANVLRELEETASQRARYNQDSADRSRTQSLNEEAMRRSRVAAQAARQHIQQRAAAGMAEDTLMSTFHKELMETCFDMMARYTFSTCSSMPRRSPVAEFLLRGGQSQSWLLGNKIITITTSGGSKVGKAGLCEKCLLQARIASARAEHDKAQPKSDQNGSGRRRHKSAAVRNITETVRIKPSSKDDIQLPRQHCDDERELAVNSGLHMTDSLEELRNKLSVEPIKAAPIHSKNDKIQAVDSVLMGLSAKPSDQSIFTPVTCNCWCTQWAEIHIRRPTSNLSWMMRIQNDQDLTEGFPDFPLADISNLFMSGTEELYEFSRKRIDSLTLEEKEYESLMQEHFYGSSQESASSRVLTELHGNLAHQSIEEIPSEEVEPAESPVSLDGDSVTDSIGIDAAMRKTSSSPDLTENQQQKLQGGEADKKLQQAYEKCKDLSPTTDTAPSDLADGRPGPSPNASTSHTAEAQAAGVVKRKAGAPLTTTRLLEHKAARDGERAKTSTSAVQLKPAPSESRLSQEAKAFSRSEASLVSSMLTPASITPDTRSSDGSQPTSGGGGKEYTHGGISPSFLFLQLYHSNLLGCGEERPVPLPNNEVVGRALKLLDLIYPYELVKVGVLYIGPGQAEDQTAILSNVYGSPRYVSFLDSLGQLLRLKDSREKSVYVGGLDQDGEDGDFAYYWQDEFIQVIFHVATLMPTRELDPKCNGKKRHIGNDYVTLVYNDSRKPYTLGTIKGQFNYVSIVIEPLDHGSNAVTVQTRDDIEDVIGHTDTKVMSDANLAILVRQMAVHAHLASIILQKQKSNPQDPYASNWLERLRQMKRIRAKVREQSQGSAGQGSSTHTSSSPQPTTATMVEDFTDFV